MGHILAKRSITVIFVIILCASLCMLYHLSYAPFGDESVPKGLAIWGEGGGGI